MEYDIIYSSRRTISLSIKKERLTVRSPYGVSRAKIEEIVLSHKEWIEKSILKQRAREEKISALTDYDIKRLREKAKAILPVKAKYYSDIMDLNYGRITITGAKTRFGSCSAKGNLSFSYFLMQYPDEAIDYVVVHELAHLKEMNHSRAFYKIVEGVLPDYKQRIRMLKK